MNKISKIIILKKVCILIVLCLCHKVVYAQNAPKDIIMEYDTNTGNLNKELPFDVSFNLKFKIDKSYRIKKVSFLKSTNKDRKEPTFFQIRSEILNRKSVKEGKNNEESDRILYDFEDIKDNTKYKYLVLRMSPLVPNRKYDIVIERKFSGEILKELIKLNSLLRNNVTKKFTDFLEIEERYKNNAALDSTIQVEKIKKMYTAIINKDLEWASYYKDSTGFKKIFNQYITVVELKCDCTFNKISEYNGKSPYNLSTYAAIYQNKLKIGYDKLDEISEFKYEMIENLINTPDLIAIINLINKGKQQDEQDGEQYKSTKKLLANLKSIDNKSLNKIFSGQGSIIGRYNQKLLTIYDLDARLLNLTSNKKAFDRFIEDLMSVRLLTKDIAIDVKIGEFIRDSNDIISLMTKNEKIIKKIINMNTNLFHNTTEDIVLTNTLLSTITLEASRLIVPDFGLVLGIHKDNNFLRPFFGANINFGPVNKDIRTKYMSNSIAPGSSKYFRYFRQHFSLLLGASLGSINVDNKREDLFDGVNVLTGLSYRPSRITRFSSGILWYNSINPNPIDSEKRLSGLWYLSFSFDLELKKSTGSTLNKIF